ncbi:chaplin family protein [Streptomyces sp. NPDC048419]|uniref:chaplin family protein n=1 Tax=Streptomyces sp. NPDC048419 TaxID=3365547 RepID=UPI0037118976
MRQVTRKGLMTVAAATGVLAAAGGYAHADSGASGSSSNSPGILSGNTVQVPVHVPVNVCGNTVDVVGILNPAMGNSCANEGGGSGSSGSHGGSHARGHTSDSPGVGSGNHVQVPIDVPVNVCGNGVNVVGVGNAAKDNDCFNGGSGGGHKTPPGHPGHPGSPGHPGHPCHPGHPGHPSHPGTPSTPPQTGGSTPGGSTPGTSAPGGSTQVNLPGTQTVTQPKGGAQLAHTGSDLPIGVVLPVGAGALLAGAVMYRKARASA